jgi:PAS domain S-box-containing protein
MAGQPTRPTPAVSRLCSNAERARAKSEREQLFQEHTALEACLHLAAIVELSEDAILSESLDGVLLSWNRAAHRIFGFTEAEAIGQPASLLVPADRRDEENKILARLRAGEPIEQLETIRLTKAGKRVNVSLKVSPLKSAAGRLVGAVKIVRDITEQKRAEEALSTVSQRLIEAQEEDRARLARELHDDINQRLVMLGMRLDRLMHKPPTSAGELRGELLQATQQISELVKDLQALSQRLHSSKLELLGLAPAAASLCKELSDQQDVKVDFSAENIPQELPHLIALCVFRVLQEALQNAIKHSASRHFQASLKCGVHNIELTVQDSGVGFDPEEATRRRGLGLTSMNERLKLVDGELSIRSEPGRGTTIHARLPLSPQMNSNGRVHGRRSRTAR